VIDGQTDRRNCDGIYAL